MSVASQEYESHGLSVLNFSLQLNIFVILLFHMYFYYMLYPVVILLFYFKIRITFYKLYMSEAIFLYSISLGKPKPTYLKFGNIQIFVHIRRLSNYAAKKHQNLMQFVLFVLVYTFLV